MNLPEFSVRFPVTTLMTFFAILLVGLVCLVQLPVDQLPEMDFPSISVITNYPGASAEDVEAKVTKILEDRLATVLELKHITSKSKEGFSIITLFFEWGTNLDERSNEVRDQFGFAEIDLPEDVERPLLFKLDVSKMPILFYGVVAGDSFPRLREIIEDRITDPLKRVPGVGAAIVRGALRRQINIEFDRDRLAGYNLTPQDIVQAVSMENQTVPGGNLKQGINDYLIRVPGEYKDVEPMKRIVLATHNGSVVRLGDVATVTDSFQEQTEYVTMNGRPGAIVMIQKQSGSNTVKVADLVHREMERLKKRLPSDVDVFSFLDTSEDIRMVINDLTGTLIIGGVLAVAAVLVFLRRIPGTLIISTTIPFSLLGAFILIYLMGYTFNMMTLFALIIAVGMVVDNAIVILENVTRHREEGERPVEAAIYGSTEVGMAITASTLTTVCVFFPIVFVKGITRVLFTEFSIVVCVVLIASLFSALTLTPMLASTIMGREEDRKQGRFFQATEWAYNAIADAYSELLGWALQHKWTVVSLAVALLAVSLGLVMLGAIGSEFMPSEDVGQVHGVVYLPAGTRAEETFRVMKVVEGIIKEEIRPEERLHVTLRCGQSSEGIVSAFGDEGPQIGEFRVRLVKKAERSRSADEIAEIIRQRAKAIQNVERIEKFVIETADPMARMVLGSERPLTVNIFGEDIEATDAVAAQIKQIIETTPGTIDTVVSRVQGMPELYVSVDRDRASALGLSVGAVADTVRASFYGRKATKFRASGDEYDIFVRLQEQDRTIVDDLRNLPVRLPNGRLVRLDNIADIQIRRGPLDIERKDQGRVVNVGSNVLGRSLGEVVTEIERKLAALELPQGIETQMAGQTEDQREAFFWLTAALGIGMVLVYMVMASQFESLLDPFVIMFSVPAAFVGVVWSLFLGGHNLNVVVFIGMLILVGVVVNNAIVLVDYINTLRARGLPVTEAVKLAGRTRLRPVLMTTLTTIAAVIPMAFGKGQGSETWNPLGLTIFGGLTLSTLVTLVLVPTLYVIFEIQLVPALKKRFSHPRQPAAQD